MSTINENGLDPALFAATVTSLTHSFGDSTRRKVYFYHQDHDRERGVARRHRDRIGGAL